jgi:hypothetical protein
LEDEDGGFQRLMSFCRGAAEALGLSLGKLKVKLSAAACSGKKAGVVRVSGELCVCGVWWALEGTGLRPKQPADPRRIKDRLGT